MKRFSIWRGATILALALLLPLTGCDSDGDRDRDRVILVDSDGYTDFDLTTLGRWLGTVANQPLSTAETDAILYTREEEKMARDAFRDFDQQYAPEAFTKIAASEQTHMDAVGMLIDKYDLTDPVTSDATGAFTNADVLALYEAFVAQGDASLEDALAAGAAIQELSIEDLDEALGIVDNRDMECVFLNLQKGSRNHLRSLVRLLDNRDVDYTPVYLTQAAFDAIVGSAIEQGTAC